RHRFAQMTVGVDYQVSTGGQSVFLNGRTELRSDLAPQHTPRIIIGGTHFWGHADFYVALPLATTDFAGDDTRQVFFTVGGETGVKLYPWRIEQRKFRPYFGMALTPYTYRQLDRNIAFGRGPTKEVIALPLLTGLTYNHKSLLLEAGLTWNHAAKQAYPISASYFAEVMLPPLSFNLALKYRFDTTISAEESWENGRTELITQKLVEKGRLSDFYVAVGPSSVWWNGTSSHNERNYPAIESFPTNIMPDFGLGYYFHKPDVNVALAYRRMTGGSRAYGVAQSIRRRSLGIEVTKMLGDYHGFAPFIGPIFSRENLRFVERIENGTAVVTEQDKWAAGITFGWDIRPNRIQSFILRTNLRWYPKLHLDLASGEDVSLGAVEFNFIQLVLYPERIF
ncbi:MAG: hypothetical protein AAF840_14290, partial [Bacteroidota bacterium]